NPSNTPNPNKAKSYFTGTFGSNFLRALSSSARALPSFCLRFNKPNFRATFPEWTSKGQESVEESIDFQIPKSTPALSFLQFHLSHIFILLAAVHFKCSLICLVVLIGWSCS